MLLAYWDVSSSPCDVPENPKILAYGIGYSELLAAPLGAVILCTQVHY